MDRAQDRLFRQLATTYRCSNCRQRFDRSRFAVITRQERLWVVSARCASCKAPQMFWVSVREKLDAPPSEKSVAELSRLNTLPPVSHDDVLDMHEFLARFDGDFRSLFARKI